MSGMLDHYFALIRRVFPEKGSGPVLGLDIGSGAIKFIEIQNRGAHCEITNWGLANYEADKLDGAIRDVFGRLAAPHPEPIIALSGKGTLIRYIEMPRMSLEDLRKSFMIEADKYFPFPPDQIYTDCHILDLKGHDNKMRVLIAAVKRDFLDERVRLLTSLGATVNTITIDALAVANAVQVLGPPPGPDGGDGAKGSEALALLDIGEKVGSMTIMVDQQPCFNRDIFFGGNDIVRGLGFALSLSPEEAAKLLFNPGDREPEIREALDSVVGNLISELRLSIDYFVTENNKSVGRLLLTGGNAGLCGLAEAVGKQLELSAEVWNPLDSPRLVKAPGAAGDETLDSQIGRYSVALGLALYG